jgi:hypothetical protein
MASFIDLLPMFLVSGISLIITLLLNHKGCFDRFHRTHYVFAGIGFIFPLLDIIQTQVALEHGLEGNPILLATLSLSQDWGWANFVIGHIVFSVLALFVGWLGRIEKATFSRVFVCFLAIVWASGVIWNILGMALWGIF